jgi:hypothetical protein
MKRHRNLPPAHETSDKIFSSLFMVLTEGYTVAVSPPPFGTKLNRVHYWPVVPAPADDDECGAVGDVFGRGKPKYSEKTCPSAALFTTNSP